MVMKNLLTNLTALVFSAFFICSQPAPAANGNDAGTAQIINGQSDHIDSPRHMMRQFLPILRRSDVDASLSYIHFPRGMGSERRRKTAANLMQLLNTRGQIDLARISDEPDGRPYDGLPPNVDVVGQIQLGKNAAAIEVEQLTLGDNGRDNGRKIWQFSSEFVESLPELLDRAAASSIVDKLPPWLAEPEFIGLHAWQWLGLGLSLLIAFGFSRLVAYLIMLAGEFIGKRYSFWTTQTGRAAALPSLRWIAGILIFRLLRSGLELSLEHRQYLNTGENFILVLAFTMLAMNVLHMVITYYQVIFDRQGRRAAIGMLQPIEKGAKALIVMVCLLAVMRALGFNVTAILAGLGVGGLAIALAAQKTVENLFGGISVILDQPVRVGDYGRFGEISGTVEDIGLRSTRVRTLDQTLVTIPNSEFSMMKLENFERRSKMRWAPRLGLRYDTTAAQMEQVLTHIREMLLAHPMVLNDPARVRFTNFGPSSLDVDIYAFLKTEEMNDYWAVVEDLNLKLMAIVAACGVEFAFPSTSVYLEKDP